MCEVTKFWKDDIEGDSKLVERIKHLRENQYGHLSESEFEFSVILPSIRNSSEPQLQQEVKRILREHQIEREKRLLYDLEKKAGLAREHKIELKKQQQRELLKDKYTVDKIKTITLARPLFNENHIQGILNAYNEPNDSMSVESIIENLQNKFKYPETMIREGVDEELLLLDKIDFVLGEPTMFLTLSSFGIDLWIDMHQY